MNRCLSLASLTLSALCVAACSSLRNSVQSAPPAAPDVLVQLRRIALERASEHDDFYTRPALMRRFGDRAEISVEETPSESRRASVVIWYGDPASSPSDRGSIRIDLGRYRRTGVQGDGVATCFMDAQFMRTSLDFESVVAKLGPGWRRNPRAEQALFIAASSEPFNPPQPRPTAPMGNAIIDYGEGSDQIELNFGASGLLYAVSEPTCHAQAQ